MAMSNEPPILNYQAAVKLKRKLAWYWRLMAGIVGSLLAFLAALLFETGFIEGMSGNGWMRFLLAGVTAWMAYLVWSLTGTRPDCPTSDELHADQSDEK
jgi:hypothetical protein